MKNLENRVNTIGDLTASTFDPDTDPKLAKALVDELSTILPFSGSEEYPITTGLVPSEKRKIRQFGNYGVERRTGSKIGREIFIFEPIKGNKKTSSIKIRYDASSDKIISIVEYQPKRWIQLTRFLQVPRMRQSKTLWGSRWK